MADTYMISSLKSHEVLQYISYAQSAINNINDEIKRLQTISTADKKKPPFSYLEPEEMAFYLKNVIKIPLRKGQANIPTKEESYYYKFIPINNHSILVHLRDTDHERGEGWDNRMDGSEHPNLRATTLMTKKGDSVKKVPTSPINVNRLKVRRTVLEVPTIIFGNADKIIAFLKSLIFLFKEGRFGNIKEKKPNNAVPQNVTIDKSGNSIAANGWGADYVSEKNNRINYNRKMSKKLIRLTESDLHRIVNETINKVIYEGNQPSQFGIDPDKIARFLFDNGVDVYQFTHQVEDVYEMLQGDLQNTNPKMALVNAIKNSSDFDDTTEQYGCQAGDAPLSKPIRKICYNKTWIHSK